MESLAGRWKVQSWGQEVPKQSTPGNVWLTTEEAGVRGRKGSCGPQTAPSIAFSACVCSILEESVQRLLGPRGFKDGSTMASTIIFLCPGNNGHCMLRRWK